MPISRLTGLTRYVSVVPTMATYSTYEAKAKFSELMRKVRRGETVIITYRGDEVAELKPIEKESTVQERIEKLREQGILSGPAEKKCDWKPIAHRPGALKRFLEERD